MEGYLMAFFHDPTRDLAVFTQSIQAFWDAMRPSRDNELG